MILGGSNSRQRGTKEKGGEEKRSQQRQNEAQPRSLRRFLFGGKGFTDIMVYEYRVVRKENI